MHAYTPAPTPKRSCWLTSIEYKCKRHFIDICMRQIVQRIFIYSQLADKNSFSTVRAIGSRAIWYGALSLLPRHCRHLSASYDRVLTRTCLQMHSWLQPCRCLLACCIQSHTIIIAASSCSLLRHRTIKSVHSLVCNLYVKLIKMRERKKKSIYRNRTLHLRMPIFAMTPHRRIQRSESIENREFHCKLVHLSWMHSHVAKYTHTHRHVTRTQHCGTFQSFPHIRKVKCACTICAHHYVSKCV